MFIIKIKKNINDFWYCWNISCDRDFKLEKISVVVYRN